MPRRRTASRRGGVDPPAPASPPELPPAYSAEATKPTIPDEEDPKPIAKGDLGGRKRSRRARKGGKKTRRRGGDDRTDAQKMAAPAPAPAPAPAAAPLPPPLTSMETPNFPASGGKKTSRTYLYGGRKSKKTGGKRRRYSRRH